MNSAQAKITEFTFEKSTQQNSSLPSFVEEHMTNDQKEKVAKKHKTDPQPELLPQKRGRPDSLNKNSVTRGTPICSENDVDRNDIRLNYLKANQMNNNERYELLKNVWKPDKSFTFPCSLEGKKQRRFVYGWLGSYSWLVYSKYVDGCFCLPCLLFETRTRHNSSKAIRLVKEPLTYWTSASMQLRDYEENSLMHKDAVLQIIEFRKLMENQSLAIDQTLNKIAAERVTTNRKKLNSILRTVILCGHENLALRGHRDDSQHYDNDSVGKSQALLDFAVECRDKVLEEHFKTCSK